MKNRCNKCRLHKCRCKVVINKPVEVKASKAGNDGLDAYEIAVLEGFVGTRDEWVERLEGKDGAGYETRYAVNSDPDNSPPIVPDDRVPSGWSLTAPNAGAGEYIWVARAKVTEGTPSLLLSNWTTSRQTGVSVEVAPARGEDIFNI